ncbi:MAG: hypothetical protein LAO06_21595 [Acidobacteriia bacterium]|nr:hypothetical protein [Terriglobia bacterium]
MPQNPFPDSVEKQALRRRDAIFLEEFRSRTLAKGLSYCGLTSAEFRDIQAWRPQLSAVHAVEIDQRVLNNMDINWRRLKLGIPLQIVPADILEYLRSSTTGCFEVYNLDFYGGFTNPKHDGTSRCREAMRSLASHHREQQRSFVVIATFNVRDRGVEQYDAFINEVRSALDGFNNVEANLKAHAKSHATKIKLSYMYACWQAGVANDFDVEFEDPFVYNSGATTLVHFCAVFIYRATALATPHADKDSLIAIANRPLKRMDGRIARVDVRPALISRPQKL